jgi:hypothetical protein
MAARYFNTVEQNEHLELIHGPWEAAPNVVDLPLDNTFWGPPLAHDMMLTFDAQGLPLARVPRPVLDETIIYHLLQDAELTSRELRQAQLADSRGNPVPLADFNAALTALIALHPYTEAQFLGQL